MNRPDGSAPAAAAATGAQADESNSSGRRSSSSRECLKRSPRSPKAEGSDSVTSQSSPSEEAGMMTEVKVKTEVPDDYIEEVIWQDDTKDSKKNIKDGPGDVPAEICVVIGGVRNQQTLGSYECGICGKKYKYYNCFQTHVRAHRDNFRYTCDICGKKYKYYSCFQEHRDLHAVDDPYDQAVIAAEEVKEEEPEPFQKIGPKTGNYTCEFCGKQYKYYTPYQEHVALHAPIRSSGKGSSQHTARHYDLHSGGTLRSALPRQRGGCNEQLSVIQCISLVKIVEKLWLHSGLGCLESTQRSFLPLNFVLFS